ncbi:MAG TPA: TonB family protein [Candidatus Dormibacteraeota bacterium]|nr:TonB family protein [Candidatus Dormibacteraeota bacterium]
MRVLLAGPDYEENLSIRYLSSSLQAAGYETVLAAFNSAADAPAVAEAAHHAEIVGLSMCFQSRAKEFLQLAQSIKSRDPHKLIVAGGHYASCAAEPLLAHHPEIDLIVIHEGERTLVEIAEALPHLDRRLPEISGLAYRDGGRVRFTPQRRTLDDLDTLPFPDRSGPVHFIAGVPTSYMMGSRGCYGNCAYCCITTLHHMAPGKRFRQRNAERIVDEMAALYHDRGSRQFVFHDDNFLVPSEAINLARLSAFEKALTNRGVRDLALVIKCRPADANRNVLRRLKDLGLVRVFLGVESATEQGLSALERAQNVEESVRALEACAELDISAQFTLMIFHPDATLATLRSDVAFMRRFSGNPLNFCRAEIYAGTPLEKRMIQLGRARGNYLAREYNLTDSAADLACTLSLDLFNARCWCNGSLMQNAIGLDHMAAVVTRLYDGSQRAALSQRVASWVRSVNLDTIAHLNEIIELSASGTLDAAGQRAILSVRERESTTRQNLIAEGIRLSSELQQLRLATGQRPATQPQPSRFRLARQAAVAVLAIGMPASGCHYGVSEMAPPPLKDVKAPPLPPRPIPPATSQDAASLSGTVTDTSGAVVTHVTLTITNTDTGQTRTLAVNEAGQYAAADLPAGHYTVKAEAQNFKATLMTGIELKAGTPQHVDIRLEIGNWGGCCEYAASPLKLQPEDLIEKKKPFTYEVGQADDQGTFQGIAKLVYGDSKMWVQIFEANRDVVEKPGVIPYGKSIVIPPRKRVVPKLLSKVNPVYPPAAEKAQVVGDVVLDVTLKEDGTVDQIAAIDGNPLLLEPATAAVKQWRYKPLAVNGKPVLKFVVVVSFGKRGNVHF